MYIYPSQAYRVENVTMEQVRTVRADFKPDTPKQEKGFHIQCYIYDGIIGIFEIFFYVYFISLYTIFIKKSLFMVIKL